jgi:LDH2 family malate/lactate/ureidoglycolate dehydrogenase
MSASTEGQGMTGNAAVDASSAQETVINAPRLERFTQAVFEQAGMPSAEAAVLAEHLVWADLRGISALGVAKIPQYLPRLREGGTSSGVKPTVLAKRGGFLAVDGHDGFGQVVGANVMGQVVETARSTGISGAVVRNTTSAGAMGRHAMFAVKEQMIGIAINNGPALMPVHGGSEKVLGNQAFALASPAGRHAPVLLDMAVSGTSLARIHEYEHRGEALPEGLALNAAGEPTVDPVEALNGILAPMAGHRGFGLAFMWEMLTGILSGGSAFSTDIGWPATANRPQGVSMLLLAIDPEVSIPFGNYLSRADELIDRIHGSRSVEGSEHPSVPGERSDATMQQRQKDGIPIPSRLLATLVSLGNDAGVSL